MAIAADRTMYLAVEADAARLLQRRLPRMRTPLSAMKLMLERSWFRMTTAEARTLFCRRSRPRSSG